MTSLLFGVTLLAGFLDAATPTPTPGAATPTPTPAASVPAPTIAPAPALPRVGIVVVGEDPIAAGALQKDLERMLSATPGISVRPAGELASKLVVPKTAAAAAAAAGPDAATKAQAAQLLDDAKNAYYDDESAKALDRLAKLEDLQERTGGFPALQRVQMRLWRSAVFLALKDEQQASDEALTALSLDPDLVIDLKELPPSLGELVDKVRKTRLKIVSVIVSGLPPVAEIHVDGRSVPSRFRTAAGHHKVSVSSPGRLDVTREFDATGDMSLSMPLPLAVPADATEAINDLAFGSASSPAGPALSALAAKLNVDWLVPVAAHSTPHTEARPMIARANGTVDWTGDVIPAGPDETTRLNDAIGPKLRAAIAKAQKLAHEEHEAVLAEAGWHETPTAGLGVAARYRTLDGGAGTVKLMFAGTGPVLGVAAVNRGVWIDGALSWITYAPSTLEVQLPDGSKKSAGGGATLDAGIGAGLRHALSANGYQDGPSIRYGLTVLVEQHSGPDVKTASGVGLGIMPSWMRVSPQLGLGARFPFGRGLALTADGNIAPFGYWADSPGKVYGTSTTAALSYGAHVAVTGGETGKLQWQLAWTASMAGADHKGTAQVPTNPVMVSTKERENVQLLTLGIAKRF
ncbi:MAG TPA: hypothetical protein VMV18_11380 [bacterium]|nr:hypothetical protein [bacterium]